MNPTGEKFRRKQLQFRHAQLKIETGIIDLKTMIALLPASKKYLCKTILLTRAR
jgi:hypothetical protein